jgi:hypothetical protein
MYKNSSQKQRNSLVKSSVNLHGINKIDNGTELILHSDNGGPMKGQTMQAACLSLGILCTYNRSRTSNDNAHMESSFKLLKHGKIIEIRAFFESLTHARKWCDEYYNWYNTEHRHSAICYITPENCYRGYGSEIMNKRNKIVQDFYTVHKQNNALRDNAGGTRSEKKAHIWRMPTKVDIMPFYTRRKKTMQGIKNAGYCGIDI